MNCLWKEENIQGKDEAHKQNKGKLNDREDSKELKREKIQRN